MATIFPNSFDEAERLIFNFADAHSLVSLSGVNKNAYDILSNGQFFQQLFVKQHPLLGKIQQLFLHLCTYYPESCWKFACVMPLKDVAPFKKEFLQAAIPLMKSTLIKEKEKINATKEEIEKRLQVLCGSHDQDPNSLIFKAGKDFEQMRLNFMNTNPIQDDFLETLTRISVEINPIMKLIENKIDEELITILTRNGPQFIERTDAFNFVNVMIAATLLQEGLFNLLVESKNNQDVKNVKLIQYPYLEFLISSSDNPDLKLGDIFDLSTVDEYLNTACALKEGLETGGIALTFITMTHSQSYLNHLSKKQISYSDKIIVCDEKLTHVERQLRDLKRFNCLYLLIDLCFAKYYHNICYDNLFSQNLWDLAFGWHNIYIKDPEDQTIKHLIEHTQKHRETLCISDILSRSCGDEASQSQWEINRLSEFLPELQEVVNRLLVLTASYDEASNLDFDLSMKTCLDIHFESISQTLPALKDLEIDLQDRCEAVGSELSTLKSFDLIDMAFPLTSLVTKLLNLQRCSPEGGYSEYNTQELLSKVSSLIQEIERRIVNV